MAEEDNGDDNAAVGGHGLELPLVPALGVDLEGPFGEEVARVGGEWCGGDGGGGYGGDQHVGYFGGGCHDCGGGMYRFSIFEWADRLDRHSEYRKMK